MKKIKKKIKSKRGVSLVELIVGIALIAIVFSSTLGSMVGGYTTTLKNADQNKAAVLNASLNEVIINAVHNMYIGGSAAADAKKLVSGEGVASSKMETITNADGTSGTVTALVSTVRNVLPEAKYIAPDDFDASNDDYRYTIEIITDDKTNLVNKEGSSIKMNGLRLKTCVMSAAGPVFYESFVPFVKS